MSQPTSSSDLRRVPVLGFFEPDTESGYAIVWFEHDLVHDPEAPRGPAASLGRSSVVSPETAADLEQRGSAQFVETSFLNSGEPVYVTSFEIDEQKLGRLSSRTYTSEDLHPGPGVDLAGIQRHLDLRHQNSLARQSTPQRQAPDAARGVSSQAGLASYRDGAQVRSLPGVPAPGQPGSRFNPIVRERAPQRSVGIAQDALSPSVAPRRALSTSSPATPAGPETFTDPAAGVKDFTQARDEGDGIATSFVKGAASGVSSAPRFDVASRVKLSGPGSDRPQPRITSQGVRIQPEPWDKPADQSERDAGDDSPGLR